MQLYLQEPQFVHRGLVHNNKTRDDNRSYVMLNIKEVQREKQNLCDL